jgi:hypothetical protein
MAGHHALATHAAVGQDPSGPRAAQARRAITMLHHFVNSIYVCACKGRQCNDRLMKGSGSIQSDRWATPAARAVSRPCNANRARGALQTPVYSISETKTPPRRQSRFMCNAIRCTGASGVGDRRVLAHSPPLK